MTFHDLDEPFKLFLYSKKHVVLEVREETETTVIKKQNITNIRMKLMVIPQKYLNICAHFVRGERNKVIKI